MIKPKLIALGIGLTAGLFGLPDSADAANFGYSLQINDPVYSTIFLDQFNTPSFTLTNLSDNGVQIESFNLTIGDTDFFYDFSITNDNDPDIAQDNLIATIISPDPNNND